MSTRQSSPLQNLRTLLEHDNLDGFILPHGDEFQNEYLPAASERLRFLTGFNGSAGLALILKDSAALFIDGRYTLAAKEQVDEHVFSLFPWTFENIKNFLNSHLEPGMTLGFDPWTMTELDLSTFNAACDPLEIHLNPMTFNPVDAIWNDRPSLPSSIAFPHEDIYSGETCPSKRTRLSLEIQKEGADALYISLPESLNWLLNIRGEDVPYTPFSLCTGILHRDASVDVFINLNKIPSSLQKSLGPEIRLHDPKELVQTLKTFKGLIWIDPARTPYAVLDLLKPHARILAKQDPCLMAKALKNTTEIEGMRTAHKKDAQALIQFLKILDDHISQNISLTESKAAQILDHQRYQMSNCVGPSFETISAVGSNGAIVHYHPSSTSDHVLTKNTSYLVDSGGQYYEGTTDVTRTIFLRDSLENPKVNHDLKEAFTRVLKGHIALASIKFPKGTTGHQLDALARQFLWEQGLDYDHGTGHGVGSFLSVHEGPQGISKRSSTIPLTPGMILSNEPGFYKEHHFGIRIESLVLVVPWQEGDRPFYAFETLTLVPIDKNLILVDLLTLQEKNWINNYHERIFNEIYQNLDIKTQDWLKEATRPLV